MDAALSCMMLRIDSGAVFILISGSGRGCDLKDYSYPTEHQSLTALTDAASCDTEPLALSVYPM